MTVLGPAESPVAALVHDPALHERPRLLEAAGAAARLALENERLQAELRAQLVELGASRARIVSAGDEERRRLERDLHDGAQQRLLGLGLALQLLREELGPGVNGASELLSEADAELRAALEELRELAHGIHPAILTEQGLDPRSGRLLRVRRCPSSFGGFRTHTCRRQWRPPPTSSSPRRSRTWPNTRMRRPCPFRSPPMTARSSSRSRTTALAVPSSGQAPAFGLSDRVEAVEGRLTIESAAGCGTRLRAELPYATLPARR